MAMDTLFVFALIGVAAALMASNRVRFDLVALIVVVALIVSGVLSIAGQLQLRRFPEYRHTVDRVGRRAQRGNHTPYLPLLETRT